jgi:hypothetical protein
MRSVSSELFERPKIDFGDSSSQGKESELGHGGVAAKQLSRPTEEARRKI